MEKFWFKAQAWIAQRKGIALMRHPSLRHDEAGEVNVGMWVGLVIGAMILVLILAAIWADFTTALTNYADNETTFGPVLQSIVPILIGAGVLLLFVAVFLKQVQ